MTQANTYFIQKNIYKKVTQTHMHHTQHNNNNDTQSDNQ